MILIDGRNLQLERGTGVATYGRCLTRALRRIGSRVGVLYGKSIAASADDLLTEVRFFDSPIERRAGRLGRAIASASYVGRGLGFDACPVPISERIIKQQFGDVLPECDALWNANRLFSRAHKAFEILGRFSPVRMSSPVKIAHWTYPLPLRVRGVPNVYTLHDLVPLKLPYTTLDDKRAYLRLVRRIAKDADHIVTVSECSRRDIIDILRVDPDRVTNTYQTVDIPREVREASENEIATEVERIFGVAFREFFIFWGAIEPKKNVGRIVEGYLRSGVTRPLLVVGSRVFRDQADLQLVEGKSGLLGGAGQGRVMHIDYLPRSLLMRLVRAARATVWPSLYEGFGLPVLESMTLGTPVLTSTTSSLPEVAGDGAYFVDPYDVQAIARGFRDLDSSSALRDELAQKGLRRSNAFSNEAYDARLREVYPRVT
jgi:glycosyltransferase involved in cell wall biosynthesis